MPRGSLGFLGPLIMDALPGSNLAYAWRLTLAHPSNEAISASYLTTADVFASAVGGRASFGAFLSPL